MLKIKKLIPKTPGVYFFRDKSGRILYIGKAANLKNRIKSYFAGQPANSRLTKLLETVAKITWQETGSEIEALILESQLIKKYHPPFNVMLRDDKQYFYVVFGNEEFSKVIITHRPTNFSQPKFLISNFQFLNKPQTPNPKFRNLTPITYTLKPNHVGPFTDGLALKTTLRLLRRIFPYCTCKQKHNNYCLNYHIGKCLGFCCLRQQKLSVEVKPQQREEYLKNINAIKEILSGKQTALIKILKKEMKKSAKKENFEEAANLRDKIEKVEKVFENARINQRDTNTQMRTRLDSPSRRGWANYTNDGLLDLRKLLKLKHSPRRIEGYDVANIQGKFATGAMVVFTDGQPDKNQYRRFRIRGKGQIYRHRQSLGLAMSPNQDSRSGGDTAMLKEVLTRRFSHPEWPRPDLIIVDGGKTQLNAAIAAFSSQLPAFGKKQILRHRKSQRLAMSPNQIPIVALTKDEKHRGTKIFVENSKEPLPLSKLLPAVRNLILKVNSEAHRFAIGYYRKLHRSHGM